MFLLVTTKHENIVHMTQDPFETIKDLGHSSLEDFRGTSDPKWQLIEAVTSKWCQKRCEYIVGFRVLTVSAKTHCWRLTC